MVLALLGLALLLGVLLSRAVTSDVWLSSAGIASFIC